MLKTYLKVDVSKPFQVYRSECARPLNQWCPVLTMSARSRRGLCCLPFVWSSCRSDSIRGSTDTGTWAQSDYFSFSAIIVTASHFVISLLALQDFFPPLVCGRVCFHRRACFYRCLCLICDFIKISGSGRNCPLYY